MRHTTLPFSLRTSSRRLVAPHCQRSSRNRRVHVLPASRRTYSERQLSVLEHVHLKADPSTGLTPYERADAAQEEHRAKFLQWKALSTQPTSGSRPAAPIPRLISFESMPTFTLGRRQDDLTAEQTDRLRQPLETALAHRRNPIVRSLTPQTKKTNRGGLTTYHGPGQIVLWPILDMHSSLYAKYGVATYASHLETTTQRLLSEIFGIQTCTVRDEPGVWVAGCNGQQQRKIAALGVHHRRYITALGIAVNIDVPVTGPEATNPWARFVPCGLEGKLVTSVAAEVGVDSAIGWDLEDLAGRWARLFEEGLVDESRRDHVQGQSRLNR